MQNQLAYLIFVLPALNCFIVSHIAQMNPPIKDNDTPLHASNKKQFLTNIRFSCEIPNDGFGTSNKINKSIPEPKPI